jgi:uncharacterized protein YbjQ (UPF0145 family)
MKCSRCRKDFGGALSFLAADLTGENVCPECKAKEKKRQADIVRLATKVLITTTPAIEGHRITDYLGIESVEIVIGTGFLSELTGDLSDFLGERSKAFERKLQDAKRVAFDRLRSLAAEQGANAVVGIDLDYTEFSGNRIGLIVNGTLVRIAPVARPAEREM